MHPPGWANLAIANTVDIGLRLTVVWRRNRLPEVLAQVRRAVSIDPELALGWVALAQAQALATNYPAAMASAQRCFDVSPNDPDCFYLPGKAELESGDPQAAVRLMEGALDRNSMPPTYLPTCYATALWANRRFDEALRAADECRARAPAFWRCSQDRSVTLIEQGRQHDAETEAKRLLAQAPEMKPKTSRCSRRVPSRFAMGWWLLLAQRACRLDRRRHRVSLPAINVLMAPR